MNNFIKGVIEEKFASKAQQRYFYAQAGKGGKKGKKWGKWAKEFSDKTDYTKIPDKVEEEEMDEIVDAAGNIARGKKSTDSNTKGITDEWTTDQVAKSGAGNVGNYNSAGLANYTRYWGEGELSKGKLIEIAMGDALGFDDTMGEDKPYDKAYNHFTKELGLSDEEAKERLQAMGYDEKLPDNMVRLVENPKKFMEEYLESVLKSKSKQNDVLEKEKPEVAPKEVNPIVKRQIFSLKNTMKSHGLSIDDIKSHLEQDNE
jgi:hypothetical protein